MNLYAEGPEKVDFTKKFPDLFTAEEGVAAIVDVPKFSYVVSQGTIHPSEEGSTFDDVLTYLGGLAFSIKFRLKRGDNENFQDYLMPPTQAVWSNVNNSLKQWKWKMMIMQPSIVTESTVRKSLSIAKMKNQDTLLPPTAFEVFTEGKCIQTLHKGDYKEVKRTLKFLEAAAKKEGYVLDKEHHAIYLNDMRRTPEQKLETIIRCKLIKK